MNWQKGYESCMDMIKRHLKENYHLSNYQIAQLGFLAKTIGSELSKIFVMAILFHDRIAEYFFALGIMLCLRCSTGGLHFYTYAGCLAASSFYLILAIRFLPVIRLYPYMQIFLLLVCILTCYLTGPVTSKYRPAASDEHNRHCKNTASIFIFLYALALYIIPENQYLTVGFWIIILHSLQLAAAKIRKEGEPVK